MPWVTVDLEKGRKEEKDEDGDTNSTVYTDGDTEADSIETTGRSDH